jgi:uncharacterized SAM-binding protein YcdF (DUF218 family)
MKLTAFNFRLTDTILIALVFLLSGGCNSFYNRFYADPAISFAEAQLKKPYDVIIVPGCPTDSFYFDLFKQRLYWANYLYKNNYAKHIIFSGSAVYTPYFESKLMRLYALDLGIHDKDISVDTQAEHTTENLYYSYRLAERLGFKNVAFATQSAQASSMKRFVKKYKFDIDMLPVVDDSIRNVSHRFDQLDVSSAIKKDFVSIEERENMLTRLSGTRGRVVKKALRKERRQKRKNARSAE